jgi:hypothetical protein
VQLRQELKSALPREGQIQKNQLKLPLGQLSQGGGCVMGFFHDGAWKFFRHELLQTPSNNGMILDNQNRCRINLRASPVDSRSAA